MLPYSNVTGVPLSVAVYLANDTYDYVPNSLSATSLLKPIRQLVLAKRVPAEMAVVDVLATVKSRMGTAIHDSLERVWKGGAYRTAMKRLGYPEDVINRIVVNPEKGTLTPEQIPVYMEIRSFREVDGVKVSGKFDLVAEGRLEDFKSTSVYTYKYDTKDEDYKLQGSIYRWLNPDIIHEDVMAIQFFFTDWSAGRLTIEENYPPRPVEQRLIPLLSLDETEQFVRSKLALIKQYENAPEDQLPLCNDKELWRQDPQWKYYKNPAKRTRSTKNFTNADEAYQRHRDDGAVGIVVEIPGQVVACKYCPAFPVCSQKDALVREGALKL